MSAQFTPKQRVVISGAETAVGKLLTAQLAERVSSADPEALTFCWIAERGEVESVAGSSPSSWLADVDAVLGQLRGVLQPAFIAMKRARWGRIVLVPPPARLRGPVAMAVIGLMRTLRLEGRRGIRVNVVLPGDAPQRTANQVLACCSPNDDCPAGKILDNGESIALQTGRGVALSGDISVEAVAAEFESITSMKNAWQVGRPTAALSLMLDTVDEARPPRVAQNAAPIRFDEQVAIVTGSGAGLGRCYALALAARGARVVVNDLGTDMSGSGESSTPAEAVVAEITAGGGDAIASNDSVSSTAGAEAIVVRAIDAFGRLDIVVNNAGIVRDEAFDLLSATDWQAVIDVHLHGSYNVTRAALQRMLKSGYGRIVMTTSAAALYGNAEQASYTAAKSAVLGLMNAGCADVASEDVDVAINAIAPLAATRMTEELFPPDLLANLQPALVAPLLLYLCSNACNANGMVLNAAMGFFSRVRLSP